MYALALMLSAFQAAAPAPAVPVPEATAQVFLRVLKTTPVFAPGMKRTITIPLLGISPGSAPFPVFVVEVPWTSAAGSGTAVALFIDIPGFAVANRMPVDDVRKQLLGAEGSWGLGELAEGKTLLAWLDEKNEQRRRLNESGVVADLRTVAITENVMHSAGGSYAELECLSDLAACFGEWKEEPLPPLAVTGDKNGYRRTFHAGPSVPARGKGPSRLLRAWAMTATPLSPDSGRRAFCMDSTLVVCATADGTMGPVVDGACPKACTPLP
jgi:hypothetical protein